MKHFGINALIAIFLLSGCLISCDKDDNKKLQPIEAISIKGNSTLNLENRFLFLSPFNSEGLTYQIKGGDGNYAVTGSTNSEKILEIVFNGEFLTLTPKSVGETAVSIKDQSDNDLLLYVKIQYHTVTYALSDSYQPYVAGENITMKEKKEIEEDIKPAFPNRTNYEFTFTTAENNSGIVTIYLKEGKYNNVIKGEFEMKQEKFEYNNLSIPCLTYNVKTEETTYTFYQVYGSGIINETRLANPPIRYVFIEDQTTKYKEKYPAVEKVLLIQSTYN